MSCLRVNSQKKYDNEFEVVSEPAILQITVRLGVAVVALKGQHTCDPSVQK